MTHSVTNPDAAPFRKRLGKRRLRFNQNHGAGGRFSEGDGREAQNAAIARWSAIGGHLTASAEDRKLMEHALRERGTSIPQPLYRGTSMAPSDIPHVGDRINVPLTSGSTRLDVAQAYSETGALLHEGHDVPVLFEYPPGTPSLNIASRGDMPAEEEHLLGGNFRVTGLSDVEGATMVHLELSGQAWEVSENYRFNENHDASGKFTTGDGAMTGSHAVGVSADPNSMSLHTLTGPRQPGETERQYNDRLFRSGQEHYSPAQNVNTAADNYRESVGLPVPAMPDGGSWTTLEAPVEREAAVGDAFAALKSNPDDPEVRAAYSDLVQQSEAQWDYLTKPEAEGGAGVKVDFVSPEDIRAHYGDPEGLNPYPTAGAQRDDLVENHHLAIASISDYPEAYHPILTNTRGGEYDTFRAVHDAFGHAAVGADFTRHGEFQAWAHHSSMFFGPGQQAASTELTGENSFLITHHEPAVHVAALLPEKLSAPPFDQASGAYEGPNFYRAQQGMTMGGEQEILDRFGVVNSASALFGKIARARKKKAIHSGRRRSVRYNQNHGEGGRFTTGDGESSVQAATSGLHEAFPNAKVDLARTTPELAMELADRSKVFAAEFPKAAEQVVAVQVMPDLGQRYAQVRSEWPARTPEEMKIIQAKDDAFAVGKKTGDWSEFKALPDVAPKRLEQTIELNGRYYENQSRFAASTRLAAAGGYHPEGSTASVIDHELGHVLDNASHFPSTVRIWESPTQRTMISDYATTNPREGFAEAFAMRQTEGIAAVREASPRLGASLARAISSAGGQQKRAWSSEMDMTPTCEGYVPDEARSVRFNQHHDEHGKFATGDGNTDAKTVADLLPIPAGDPYTPAGKAAVEQWTKEHGPMAAEYAAVMHDWSNAGIMGPVEQAKLAGFMDEAPVMDVPLYRGTSAVHLDPGATFQIGPSSFSRSAETGDSYATRVSHPTVIEVSGARGLPVEGLSKYPEEHEVISGGSFTVVFSRMDEVKTFGAPMQVQHLVVRQNSTTAVRMADSWWRPSRPLTAMEQGMTGSFAAQRPRVRSGKRALRYNHNHGEGGRFTSGSDKSTPKNTIDARIFSLPRARPGTFPKNEHQHQVAGAGRFLSAESNAEASTRIYVDPGGENGINGPLRNPDEYDDEDLKVASMYAAQIEGSMGRTKEDVLGYRGIVIPDGQTLDPGVTFTDHGLVSMAASHDVAQSFAEGRVEGEITLPARLAPGEDLATVPVPPVEGTPAVLAIEVPKGSYGRTGEFDLEETLLPRNTTFTVQGRASDGTVLVTAKESYHR